MSMEMDVNYLLLRQQISLIRAQTSPSRQGRAAYECLAQGYADRVDAYRRHNRLAMEQAH